MAAVSKSDPNDQSAFSDLAIAHQIPKRDDFPESNDESVHTFCSRKATEHAGIHIYYLPSVKNVLRDDWEDESAQRKSAATAQLREHLTREYHIPKWFWRRRGWDANGFFASKEEPISDAEVDSSHCSFSRFLIKEVEDQSMQYHWRFLAFTTLWFKKRGTGDTTLILLCFDLRETSAPPSGPMHATFANELNTLVHEEVLQCPLSIYVPLLEIIVSQFNRAIWTFRVPVRNVERSNVIKTPPPSVPNKLITRRATTLPLPGYSEDRTLKNETYDDIERDRERKVARYRDMHELSRHIIHSSETLKAAIRTVSDIVRESIDCARPCCSARVEGRNDPRLPKLIGTLHSHASFLQNLNERTDAFYKRIQNEITLAFHLVDAEDTSYTRHILRETRHDGRELTTVVSVLSVLFLPPAFTASFFGMNFPFGFGSLKPIWIWVVATISLWFVAFLILLYALAERHKEMMPPPILTHRGVSSPLKKKTKESV